MSNTTCGLRVKDVKKMRKEKSRQPVTRQASEVRKTLLLKLRKRALMQQRQKQKSWLAKRPNAKNMKKTERKQKKKKKRRSCKTKNEGRGKGSTKRKA